MGLIFDIESRPQPVDVLTAKCPPFKPPKKPGPFDPSTVKVGRLTAPKAEEKIAQAKAKHEKEADEYKETCEKLASEHLQKFIEGAALSALTGEVLAIGYGAYGEENFAMHAVEGEFTEKFILEKFWEKVTVCRSQRRRIIAYNEFQFDLPFLVHRSWFHQIEVPGWIMDKNFRYLDPIFVDLRKVWNCGNYQGFSCGGIGGICKFFGLPAKPESEHVLEKFEGKTFPMTGEHFWRYWDNSPQTRDIATAYLRNDVDMVRLCAPRMGIKAKM